MSKSMTIKARMTLFVSVTLLLAVGIVILSLISSMQFASVLEKVNSSGVHGARYLANAQNAMWQLRYGISQYLAVPDEASRKTIVGDSVKWHNSMEESLKLYSDTKLSDEAKSALNDLMRVYGQYKDSRPKWLALMEEGKTDEAVEFRNKTILVSGAETVKALNNLIDIQTKNSDQLGQQSSNIILITTIAVGILLVLVTLFTAISITKGLTNVLGGEPHQIAAIVKQISAGDLAGIVLVNQTIPAGSLLSSMYSMVQKLKDMFSEMSNGVDSLSNSATELFTVSRSLSTSASASSARVQDIAAAAEEMSANMMSVSLATEQATTNVNTVSSATEQMTVTIAEVADYSDKACNITGTAVLQAAKITEQITALGKAAHDIGKVTETITAISAQTNLLALNATIEAARAGVAGKGFTVVATEIKELAQQTAAATEGIRDKIENIQASTTETVQEIGKISQVIQEVNDIISKTSFAIVQQYSVTQEISTNISMAAHGMLEVNQNVSQTSGVAEMIARDISDTNHAVTDITNSTHQVLNSAENLSNLAEMLKSSYLRFKL